jgi:sugar lactone lactonase YvrE
MKKPYIPLLISLLSGGLGLAATVPTHAIANLVLGQSNFTSGAPVTPTSSFSLAFPSGITIDPISRKVFVADRTSNRVLRYPSVTSLTNGAGAEAVFGQARFSTNSSAGGDLGMSGPSMVFLDRRGRLWVADSMNNRVLMFEAATYRETGAYPDRVYGQPDFATNTSDVTDAKMHSPHCICVDSADRLWVSDSSNNRVLRFDTITNKASGASADGVLGQALFTTSAPGAGSSGLQSPVGITISSGGELFVSCLAASRVLRFDNAASLGNGAGATAVLGQPDFATTTSGTSSTKFTNPYGAFISSSDTLWVSDSFNNRQLRFDKASTKATGSAANGVVGQANFTTNTAGTTNRTIKTSFFQPFVDTAGALWVPDSLNHRVLRFPADTTAPILAVTSTVPATRVKKKLTIKGTASDTYGISKVQYTINGGSLKTATGTTNWEFIAPLKLGRNRIVVFATDSVGNKSINKVLKVKRLEN